MKTNILCILILFLIVSGCASPTSRTTQKWKAVTKDELRREVEVKSNCYHAWSYNGSDDQFHYFTRSPQRVFIGRYKNFKIRKPDFPMAVEIPLKGSGIIGSQGSIFSSSTEIGRYHHDLNTGFRRQI